MVKTADLNLAAFSQQKSGYDPLIFHKKM